MDIAQFEDRKRDHIRHAMDPAHQALGLGGFEQIRLRHEALPDFNFSEVEIHTNCLGQPSKTPFYVAGMTAGHPDAVQLNRMLARACARRGWAMGVGSQRRDLETARGSGTDQWAILRKEAPELVLFANLGISQLAVSDLAELSKLIPQIRNLIEDLGARALAIHANALQEVIQPEGTPHFKNSLASLDRLCRDLGCPIILKETGCGFSRATLERLAPLSLAAIDVSGLGGTHWGRIEGARAETDSVHARAARTFADWGVPTAQSVVNARKVFGKSSRSTTAIWASGGVRSGLDAAKLIALGAERVGYAKPALEAALEGEIALDRWMETQEYELRVAMFCTGSRTLQDLRREGVVDGEVL
jgi:isopentenyl-diphosphate delta-isomerase